MASLMFYRDDAICVLKACNLLLSNKFDSVYHRVLILKYLHLANDGAGWILSFPKRSKAIYQSF